MGVARTMVVRLTGDDRLALTMATAAERERQLQRALGECALSRSWIFTLGGCLISIPIGIKRKSLGPLVFYGTTGAMVDIIQGISLCEKELEELKAFMEEKKAGKHGGADGSGSVSGSESKERSGVPQDIAQTLGAMVDIIQGIGLCEKEREALKTFMEEKKAAKEGGADRAGSGVRDPGVGERSGISQDIAQTLPR
ncbi:unnamed protein product [Closterium sp. Yama58-4]|nr:unnamed protein product [Closterium sp. Yama58-4]